MLRNLADVSWDIKKSDSEFYENYASLDVKKVAAKTVVLRMNRLHPNAKIGAQLAEIYSSNSPEETHISLVLKFHHLASIKIWNNFFFLPIYQSSACLFFTWKLVFSIARFEEVVKIQSMCNIKFS